MRRMCHDILDSYRASNTTFAMSTSTASAEVASPPSLVWRASAPLAGAGNLGRLSLDEPFAGRVPFPGELEARDAIGLLLGVLDLPPEGSMEKTRGGYRVALDGRGRAARLDEAYRIVGLELPHGARASYEPGDAIPRRIDAQSPDGTAHLTLSSFGDWPSTERIP